MEADACCSVPNWYHLIDLVNLQPKINHHVPVSCLFERYDMLTGIDVVEKVERQGLLKGAFVDHFVVARSRRSARPAQEVKTVNK